VQCLQNFVRHTVRTMLRIVNVFGVPGASVNVIEMNDEAL
jgi:hypothetical protein